MENEEEEVQLVLKKKDKALNTRKKHKNQTKVWQSKARELLKQLKVGIYSITCRDKGGEYIIEDKLIS